MRDDLPHAMRETARRLEPDVVRLTAGGVSRGTRMRRIERAVQILGSAVAVAVVFAGVTLVETHRGTETGTQPAASGGGSARATSPTGTAPTAPTAPAPTAPTTPATPTAPTATRTFPDIATPQIARAELVTDLKSSLARTGVMGSSYFAFGTDSLPATTTTVRKTILVDAQLSAAKNVGFLSIAFSGPWDDVPKPGKPRPLTDGSLVYVSLEDGSSDGRRSDRSDLQVTLVRPDGSSLSAAETNAPNPKSAAAYAGAPLLLTVDQIVTLLDSPIWDDALAAAEALPPADPAALAPSFTPSFTSSLPSPPSSSPS